MTNLSRDEVIAQSVGQMHILGRFTREFHIYGCAAYDQENVMYVLSMDIDKIYQWKYALENINKDITEIESLTIRSLVPAGMESMIADDLKRQMLKMLSQKYPRSYWQVCVKDIDQSRGNEVYEILLKARYALEGIASKEQLDLYQGLLNDAYTKRMLGEKLYYDLSRWVEVCQRDLEIDIQQTDMYSKVFYGFAYFEGQQPFRFYVDGCAHKVYQEMEGKRAKNCVVSPIIGKKFWYNNNEGIALVRIRSIEYFKDLFDENYRDVLSKIARA